MAFPLSNRCPNALALYPQSSLLCREKEGDRERLHAVRRTKVLAFPLDPLPRREQFGAMEMLYTRACEMSFISP